MPAVGEPDDAHEREADRVAERVVRVFEPGLVAPDAATVRRPGAPSDGTEAAEVATQQALAGDAEDDELFTQSVARTPDSGSPAAPAPTAPPVPPARAGRPVAGGEPLPPATRHGMERAFGHDFARVRVHRDAEADRTGRALGALAFTRGSHVFFRSGRYDPDGLSGRRLLAHELAHVVQQGEAAPRPGEATAGPAPAATPYAPAIQRFAIWRDGVVNETNNLADLVVNGGPAGSTPPTLNGAVILTTAQARAAIQGPDIAFSPAAGGGVTAKVSSTPVNVGSYEETVLAPGPWTTLAPKATIGAMFPALAQCAGPGDSTFRAIGDPSDAHMHASNRRHEDRHAADHETAFGGSLVPWDSNLIVAEVLEEEFPGATEADAEAALHARMGGTPEDVADEYITEALRLGGAFHATPEGGPVGGPIDPAADADCSNSSAGFTNPS